MMDWLRSRLRSTPWILRYLEWSLLVLTAWSAWRDGVEFTAPETMQAIAVLAGFAGLSSFFPRHHPVWLRLGYLSCGILLFLLATAKGWKFDGFLYLYLAKSCFLLTRIRAVITAAIAATLSTLIATWSQPATSQVEMVWHQTATPSRSSHAFVIDISTDYWLPSIVTLMICFTLIAEQKSRSRADGLAQEVETLVATLERQRIARDIHDSLGHTLTTLNIHLAVAKKWYPRDADKALHALNTAQLLATQCIEEVRQTLQTMRQSNFDLNQALMILVEQTQTSQPLQVHWEINLPPLPLQTSHHLYCILREGLINVQKHARAAHVDVRAVAIATGIMLEVADDGQGFNPHLPSTGLGLRGIEERVQLLGGQLVLHTAPGQGTKLQVTMPLYD